MSPVFENMNGTDIAIYGGILAGAAWGAWSGAVRQIGRLAAFVGAVYAGLGFHGRTEEWLLVQFPQLRPEAAMVGGYLLPFLGAMVGGFALTALAERIAKASQLSALNRLAGAGLGAAKQALIATLVLWGLAQIPDSRVQDALRNSQSAQALLSFGERTAAAIPQQYKDELSAAIERLKAAGIEGAGKVGGLAAHELADGLDRVAPLLKSVGDGPAK